MASRSLRRADAAAAVVALVWLAATIGMRHLLLPDEGRYVGVAYEMLRSGDWLTPTLNGLPFFHKPPLFYWITAASMSIFGVHDAAARVAPLLGAWIGIGSIWYLARRRLAMRVGWLSVAAMLAQPLVYVGAQFANMDMLVAGLISAAIVALAEAALRAQAGVPARWPLAAAHVAMGLAVLAKGLIGIVIPVLVMAVALVWAGRWRLWQRLLWWPGVVLSLLIAAPWFVLMQRRFPDFLYYVFVVQHVERYAGGGFNNVQPVWFFVAVLALFCLPWWPWLWRAVRTPDTADVDAAFVRRLLWAWAIVVVVFFSLPQSKLVGYVLPAIPPLACLAALGYASDGRRTPARVALWVAGLALGAVVGAGTVVWLVLHPQKSTYSLAQVLRTHRTPGEPVVMLGRYDYDLPLYARLAEPVAVVSDWNSPAAWRADNWRKELVEAGRFASLRARGALLGRADLAAVVCRGPAWLIGSSEEQRNWPFLATLAPVATRGDVKLWRADPSVAASTCARTPIDGLPSTSALPRRPAPGPGTGGS